MIYIDKWMRRKNKQGVPVLCCHMTADSLSELHDFAKKIGLERHWFQKARKHPHYDIKSFARYVLAVENGARMVDSKTIVFKAKRMLDKDRKDETMEQVVADFIQFSLTAWEQTPSQCLLKAKQEAKEAYDAMESFDGIDNVIEEIVDFMFAGFSAYARLIGLKAQDTTKPEIFDLMKHIMRKKVNIIKEREWKRMPDGTYQHVKKDTSKISNLG